MLGRPNDPDHGAWLAGEGSKAMPLAKMMTGGCNHAPPFWLYNSEEMCRA